MANWFASSKPLSDSVSCSTSLVTPGSLASSSARVLAIRDLLDPCDALLVVVGRSAQEEVPFLGHLPLVVQMSVVGDPVDLVREPEGEILVKQQVVGVVAQPLVPDQIDSGVDPVPALLRRVGHHRDVVGHVVAVKRPDLPEAWLELGDQVGVRHRLVEEPLLLHHRELDPEVVDDEASQGADRGTKGDDGRGALDGDVGVASLGPSAC